MFFGGRAMLAPTNAISETGGGNGGASQYEWALTVPRQARMTWTTAGKIRKTQIKRNMLIGLTQDHQQNTHGNDMSS